MQSTGKEKFTVYVYIKTRVYREGDLAWLDYIPPVPVVQLTPNEIEEWMLLGKRDNPEIEEEPTKASGNFKRRK